MKVCLRLGVVGFMVLSLWQPAEAARITITQGVGEGEGTIVNDGSQDVASSNGTAFGETSLMSELGLSNSTLASDLASLSFTGLISPVSGSTASSANLIVLRLYGTVAPASCADCGLLSESQVGFSGLHNPETPAVFSDTKSVLFTVDIVGPDPSDEPIDGAPPAWLGPINLASPNEVPVGINVVRSLSQLQIDFIVARVASGNYNVADISLGMGLRPEGVDGDVTATFDIIGRSVPQPTPEPGTLMLLAAGLAATGMRRWRSQRAASR